MRLSFKRECPKTDHPGSEHSREDKAEKTLIQSQKLYSLSSDTFYLLRRSQTLPVSRRKGPKLQLSMERMSKRVVNLHHIETGGKEAGYTL